MVGIVLLCLVLVVIAALALAPPTFLSNLFDGEKSTKTDWTEK